MENQIYANPPIQGGNTSSKIINGIAIIISLIGIVPITYELISNPNSFTSTDAKGFATQLGSIALLGIILVGYGIYKRNRVARLIFCLGGIYPGLVIPIFTIRDLTPTPISIFYHFIMPVIYVFVTYFLIFDKSISVQFQTPNQSGNPLTPSNISSEKPAQ